MVSLSSTGTKKVLSWNISRSSDTLFCDLLRDGVVLKGAFRLLFVPAVAWLRNTHAQSYGDIGHCHKVAAQKATPLSELSPMGKNYQS